MLRILQILLGLSALTPVVVCLADSAPATRAALDPHVWANRNVEVLRQAVQEMPDALPVNVTGYFGFSMNNPMLRRDPYAGEVAELARTYQRRLGDEARRLDTIINLLGRPEAERMVAGRETTRPADAIEDEADAMAERLAASAEPAEVVRSLVNQALTMLQSRRPRLAVALVGRAESFVQEREDWAGLSHVYAVFARTAGRRGHVELSDDYLGRLLDVVRRHPSAVAEGGEGAEPLTLVRLLLDRGRGADLEGLIAAQPPAGQGVIARAWVYELASRADLDAAREVVQRYLRAIDAEAADVLNAALAGQVRAAPGTGGFTSVRSIQGAVARGHASRGDVEVAARMLVDLESSREQGRAETGGLDAYDWAKLARLAAEGGHADAARRGFGRAADEVERMSAGDADDRRALRALVCEAAEVGAFDLAFANLSTGGAPGAGSQVRLAQIYRERGNTERARDLLNAALNRAYESYRREGVAMARAAVELQRLGDGERAERVLLDALDRIEGVDFGFGGTGAVVDAAVEMGRADLLDRLYEQSDFGERLLLSIVAARRAASAADAGGE